MNLLEHARVARTNAYAPYSSIKVGAVVITENDEFFLGCNIENESLAVRICAGQSRGA